MLTAYDTPPGKFTGRVLSSSSRTRRTVSDMDFKRITDKAKQALDERGGPERLKREAERLKTIATGPGSAGEKARAAADVVKQAATTPPDSTSRPKP